MRTPKRRPDSTTDIIVARRSGGARSAARRKTICGVTVDAPIKNEIALNVARDDVVARPIVSEEEIRIRSRISCRRLTRSPSGVIKRRPVAYLLRGELRH